MGKKTGLPKRGRPKSENPLAGVIRLRVRPEVIKALDAYQERHKLLDRSEAARQALAETLRGGGLL